MPTFDLRGAVDALRAGAPIGNAARSIRLSGGNISGAVGRQLNMADRLGTDQGTYDGSQLMAALAQGGGGVAAAIEALQAEQAQIRAYLEALSQSGLIGGQSWQGIPLFSTTVAQAAASVAFTITGWIGDGCLLGAELANPHAEDGTWFGLTSLAVGGKSIANAQNLPPTVLDYSRFPEGGGFRLDTAGQNLTGNSSGAAGATINPAIVVTVFGAPASGQAGLR